MIRLFSYSCPNAVKHCSISLGAMHFIWHKDELQDAVDSTFVIGFPMLSILSVKKCIKSLLLNCEGKFSLGDA